MYEPLVQLEKLEQRTAVLQQISGLGDFRRGSVTTTSGTCGTPSCHCHKPNDPGHGPTFRLTYKLHGKTVSVPIPAANLMSHQAMRDFAHEKAVLLAPQGELS